ncbi:MAG TPA: polysaccharide biosynthesis/export family protein [Rhodopila sp.]|uniref:polysaccharide biosynthesis/export family protein n=1 Tax=Rhodopila sp. TaxID=2480087 RepID=UPI002D00DCA4|nr:polysaccharide biosynthesis/export family protein [Rhodopila sp.]HVY17103.1 polysaccharide biosynthesis/export family protein [Rhodopila sp.]
MSSSSYCGSRPSLTGRGRSRSIFHGIVGTGLACLAGCSTLPKAGPTTSQIIDQAQAEKKNFDFLEIDRRVVDALGRQPASGFKASFEQYGRPAEPTIGVGDSLSISIWQSGVASLSGSQGTAVATTPAENDTTRPPIAVPDQVVSSDGSIVVPYAGRIRATGQTIAGLESTITRRLADRLVEPQVIVSLTKSVTDTVTVSGEAIGTVRVPLSARGDRVLDVIAAAGGSKTPTYETFVRLSRNGVTSTMSLSRLTSDPSQNIYVWPNDTINLLHAPETFVVMGATTNNNQLSFGADDINLVQALAKAGGLMDTRADPRGVFLLRFEPTRVVEAEGATPLPMGASGLTPVVYHLDLEKIGGYFLAAQFPIHNNDVLYVANSRSDSAQKLFTLIGTLSGPVVSGAVISRGVQ